MSLSKPISPVWHSRTRPIPFDHASKVPSCRSEKVKPLAQETPTFAPVTLRCLLVDTRYSYGTPSAVPDSPLQDAIRRQRNDETQATPSVTKPNKNHMNLLAHLPRRAAPQHGRTPAASTR